jgi:hypothetical protein
MPAPAPPNQWSNHHTVPAVAWGGAGAGLPPSGVPRLWLYPPPGEYRQSCRLAMAAVAQQLDAAVAEAATARARLIYAEDATMAQLFGGLDGAMALDAIVKTYQDRSPTITMQ